MEVPNEEPSMPEPPTDASTSVEASESKDTAAKSNPADENAAETPTLPTTAAPGSSGISAGQAEAEKKLAHYKRLILQSRQMLEAYQKQLAEKDKGLEEMKQRVARAEVAAKKALAQAAESSRQLAELSAKKSGGSDSSGSSANGGGGGGSNGGSGAGCGGGSGGADKPRVPLKARRRVDESGGIWVLFDFMEESSSLSKAQSGGAAGGVVGEWRRFTDEVAMADFIRKDSGEPLGVPPSSLGPEESARLIQDSKQSVAKVTEDFRRFRVKAEIARKQLDAEARQVKASSILEHQRRISGHDLEGERVKVRELEEQLAAAKEEGEEQAEGWRRATDELKKEVQALKSEGSEATLAAQWRHRFEQCNREKAELSAKLRSAVASASSPPSLSPSLPASPLGDSGEGRGDAAAAGPASEMGRRYNELREEYKLYRKRAMEAIQEKEAMLARYHEGGKGGGGGGGGKRGGLGLGDGGGLDRVPTLNSAGKRASQSGLMLPEDPRLQYLKNLMLKYLCTDEFEAKEHMERAMTTILHFSAAEVAFVAERRAEAAGQWIQMSSWLNFDTPPTPPP